MENEVGASLIKANYSFHPPRNKNNCLEQKKLQQQQTFQTSCKKSGLIKAEWTDLIALKNTSELITKKADTRSCLVLMNKPHYKEMENSSVRIAAPFFWILPCFFSFLVLAVYEIDLENLLRVYNLLYFP